MTEGELIIARLSPKRLRGTEPLETVASHGGDNWNPAARASPGRRPAFAKNTSSTGTTKSWSRQPGGRRHPVEARMVETLKQLIHDWVLHLDKSLGQVIQHYGAWTYAILFVVVFCETGLVVTPFLPGDSLLFAAGTFAGLGEGKLDPAALFVVLSLAAIGGDTVNYWIGAAIGPRAFQSDSRLFRKEYLQRHPPVL